MALDMITKFLIGFLCLLMILTTTTTTSTDASSTSAANTQKVDFFILSLTWPKSFCQIQKDLKPACKNGSHVPTTFTVHGLWPNLLGGGDIDPKSKGCSKKGFQYSIILQDPELLRKATKDWPDILQYTNGETKSIISSGFWSKEWDKHGVCSNLEQNPYMRLTLDKYHEVLPAITRAIQLIPYPRNVVNPDTFRDDIAGFFNDVIPKMVCTNRTEPPYDQYLTEIRFNLTNAAPYTFRDAVIPSNCVSSLPVNFPQ